MRRDGMRAATLMALLCTLATTGTISAQTGFGFAVSAATRTTETSTEVTKEGASGGEARTPPPEPVRETSKSTVRLWADVIEHRGGDGAVVYDFAARHARTLPPEGSPPVVTSLHALVAFRSWELRSRLAQGRILRIAGAGTEAPFAPIHLECLFSVATPRKRERRIEAVEEDDTTKWIHRDVVLTHCTWSETVLPVPLRRSFARWLAHRHHLHPQVLQSLRTERRLPAEIHYRYRDIGRDVEVTLTLGAAAPLKEAAPSPPAGLRRAPLGEGLEPLRARITDPEALKARKTKWDLYRLGRKARAKGDYIGAFLAIMEAFHQGDGLEPERVQKLVEAAGDDERFAAFVGAAQSRRPKRDLETMERLLEDPPARGHVMKLNLAALHGTISQGGRGQSAKAAQAAEAEAFRLYREALTANPFLAGAWKDLGDLYRNRWDLDSAWTCWDTGRSFAPDHPMLNEITGRETQLLKDAPLHY